MKNSNSNTFMLLTGIVAGASAVLFLQSKKGQQIMDIVMTKGEELKDAVLENAESIITESKDVMSDIIDENKDKLSAMKEVVQDSSESKLDGFQQGIKKAKEQLNKA